MRVVVLLLAVLAVIGSWSTIQDTSTSKGSPPYCKCGSIVRAGSPCVLSPTEGLSCKTSPAITVLNGGNLICDGKSISYIGKPSIKTVAINVYLTKGGKASIGSYCTITPGWGVGLSATGNGSVTVLGGSVAKAHVGVYVGEGIDLLWTHQGLFTNNTLDFDIKLGKVHINDTTFSNGNKSQGGIYGGDIETGNTLQISHCSLYSLNQLYSTSPVRIVSSLFDGTDIIVTHTINVINSTLRNGRFHGQLYNGQYPGYNLISTALNNMTVDISMEDGNSQITGGSAVNSNVGVGGTQYATVLISEVKWTNTDLTCNSGQLGGCTVTKSQFTAGQIEIGEPTSRYSNSLVESTTFDNPVLLSLTDTITRHVTVNKGSPLYRCGARFCGAHNLTVNDGSVKVLVGESGGKNTYNFSNTVVNVADGGAGFYIGGIFKKVTNVHMNNITVAGGYFNLTNIVGAGNFTNLSARPGQNGTSAAFGFNLMGFYGNMTNIGCPGFTGNCCIRAGAAGGTLSGVSVPKGDCVCCSGHGQNSLKIMERGGGSSTCDHHCSA